VIASSKLHFPVLRSGVTVETDEMNDPHISEMPRSGNAGITAMLQVNPV
jgi:hypothetical protein